MAEDDSFAAWRESLGTDRNQAGIEIWNRFAARLNQLAADRIHAKVRRLVDPDDILQTAYRTFVRNCDRSAFNLTDWAGLWGLLVTITVRKCIRANQRHLGPNRNLRRDQGLSPVWEYGSSPSALVPPSRDPTPEEAACYSDLVEALCLALSERERLVIALRRDRYTVPEIAEQLRVSERTIERTLAKAREILGRLDRESSED